jgi:purine nucleosidase
MTARPIILDCDPGQDDAICLLLAMAAPERLDILGVTAVAGNVPLALTARNARLICDLAGRADIGVYAGCAQPLKRRLLTAEHIHGRSGLDGVDIVEPRHPLATESALAFLHKTLAAAADGAITIVATGPLTNVATLLIAHPKLADKIAELVVMGGARSAGGNITPSAEFNFHVDPEAAAVILRCGRPLTLFGLDVTHQAPVTAARRANIAALDNPVADAVAGMMERFARHEGQRHVRTGAPLHDPCTVAYLLEPGLFQGELLNVEIETASLLTLGHSAVDEWQVSGRKPNAVWMRTLDTEGFYRLLTAHLSRYGRG